MFHGEKKDGVKEKSGSLLSRIDDARNVLVATKLRDGGLFSWPENTPRIVASKELHLAINAI